VERVTVQVISIVMLVVLVGGLWMWISFERRHGHVKSKRRD